MGILIGVLEQGLIYGIMALGVYITYKILDFPDLTTDGSFPAGAAITAVLLTKGVNPYLSLLISFISGKYYRGCWHVVSRGFFCRYSLDSSLLKAVYDPKASVPHAASLRQGSPHCARFPTAASRRSLGRVSVPIWPVGLSTRLPVVGTVGRHPAVYLMGRGAIPSRRGFSRGAMRHPGVSGITRPFGRLSRGRGQVLHVLLSRSPLASLRRGVPFDLHVLGAPPAFILSQDRTLRPKISGLRARPVPSVHR